MVAWQQNSGFFNSEYRDGLILDQPLMIQPPVFGDRNDNALKWRFLFGYPGEILIVRGKNSLHTSRVFCLHLSFQSILIYVYTYGTTIRILTTRIETSNATTTKPISFPYLTSYRCMDCMDVSKRTKQRARNISMLSPY